MPEEAREQLALNLRGSVEQPQVAFAVKQGKLKSISDAVESYLQPSTKQMVAEVNVVLDDSEIVAGAAHHLKLILERIEAGLKAATSALLTSAVEQRWRG